MARSPATGRGPGFVHTRSVLPAAVRVTAEPRAGGMSAAAQAGVSLLELLVALALAVIVVLASVRLLSGSRAAQASGARASDAVLTLDLAAGLLGSEVRRAGYAPFPLGTVDAARPGTTLQLEVHAGRPSGDAVSVTYLDDRLAGAVVLRALRFEVGVDARGEPQLYRITASGAKQPLVQGVTRLTIAGWVDDVGLHDGDALVPGPLHPWVLLLRLDRASPDHARRVAVPLPSRPSTTVAVGP